MIEFILLAIAAVYLGGIMLAGLSVCLAFVGGLTRGLGWVILFAFVLSSLALFGG